MKKVFLFAGVAALTMTSCSNDIDFAGSSEGVKLQVSADIDEMCTRVSDTSWDANDAIGVSDDNSNTNVKFVTTNGDGSFTSDQTIYILGDENHSFTAYYPYSESATESNTTITFTEPTDFMYGTATATRQSPEAKFTFAHKMSQLSFAVTDPASATTKSGDGDSDATTSAETTITLKGVVMGGTFDTKTGTVTPGSQTGDYKVTTTLGKAASFILPPQTFTDNKVQVTVSYNGKTYGGTISLEKSQEGNNMQYSLAVSKENESASLTVSSETITGWTPTDKGTIDMEEKEEPNTLEIGDFLLSDGSVVDMSYDLTKLASGKKVVGVVYYVGNAQPSVLYSGTYTESQDILKKEAPSATNGLAIAINNGNDGTTARMYANSGKFDYSAKWYKLENNADAALYIGTTISTTSIGEKFLGYNNTAIIEKVGEAYGGDDTGAGELIEKLTAFRSANTVSGNTSKWYLPSYAELKQIQDNYSTISTSITKAGGELKQFTDYTYDNIDATKYSEKFYWSSDFRGGQYSWVSPMTALTSEQQQYITRNSSGTKGYFRFAIAF